MMPSLQRRATLAWVIAVSTYGAAVSTGAQQSGFAGGSSGGGPLSASVIATWEAHFEPVAGKPVTDPFNVPTKLDLVVLWRGTPGWFDDADLSMSIGGSDGVHRVATRGLSLEVRFDQRAGTVSILGKTMALAGANVLLLDFVDDAGGIVVAGTTQIDAMSAPRRNGEPTDPLTDIIRRSPALFDYLRCDPAFTDPSDPNTALRLRNCAALR